MGLTKIEKEGLHPPMQSPKNRALGNNNSMMQDCIEPYSHEVLSCVRLRGIECTQGPTPASIWASWFIILLGGQEHPGVSSSSESW